MVFHLWLIFLEQNDMTMSFIWNNCTMAPWHCWLSVTCGIMNPNRSGPRHWTNFHPNCFNGYWFLRNMHQNLNSLAAPCFDAISSRTYPGESLARSVWCSQIFALLVALEWPKGGIYHHLKIQELSTWPTTATTGWWNLSFVSLFLKIELCCWPMVVVVWSPIRHETKFANKCQWHHLKSFTTLQIAKWHSKTTRSVDLW